MKRGVYLFITIASEFAWTGAPQLLCCLCKFRADYFIWRLWCQMIMEGRQRENGNTFGKKRRYTKAQSLNIFLKINVVMQWILTHLPGFVHNTETGLCCFSTMMHAASRVIFNPIAPPFFFFSRISAATTVFSTKAIRGQKHEYAYRQGQLQRQQQQQQQQQPSWRE